MLLFSQLSSANTVRIQSSTPDGQDIKIRDGKVLVRSPSGTGFLLTERDPKTGAYYINAGPNGLVPILEFSGGSQLLASLRSYEANGGGSNRTPSVQPPPAEDRRLPAPRRPSPPDSAAVLPPADRYSSPVPKKDPVRMELLSKGTKTVQDQFGNLYQSEAAFHCGTAEIGRREVRGGCQKAFITAGHCGPKFEGTTKKEYTIGKLGTWLVKELTFVFHELFDDRGEVPSADSLILVAEDRYQSPLCQSTSPTRIAAGRFSPDFKHPVGVLAGETVYLKKQDGTTAQGKVSYKQDHDYLRGRICVQAWQQKGGSIAVPGDSGGPVYNISGELVAPVSTSYGPDAELKSCFGFDPTAAPFMRTFLEKNQFAYAGGQDPVPQSPKVLPPQNRSPHNAAADSLVGTMTLETWKSRCEERNANCGYVSKHCHVKPCNDVKREIAASLAQPISFEDLPGGVSYRVGDDYYYVDSLGIRLDSPSAYTGRPSLIR